ncbi:hypothetical protein FB451DRAFT_1362157 [Mycena latifolia]|nr:hypothetical protein FB451DRAFT_1362157 [Mycena latifolia]
MNRDGLHSTPRKRGPIERNGCGQEKPVRDTRAAKAMCESRGYNSTGPTRETNGKGTPSTKRGMRERNKWEGRAETGEEDITKSGRFWLYQAGETLATESPGWCYVVLGHLGDKFKQLSSGSNIKNVSDIVRTGAAASTSRIKEEQAHVGWSVFRSCSDSTSPSSSVRVKPSFIKRVRWVSVKPLFIKCVRQALLCQASPSNPPSSSPAFPLVPCPFLFLQPVGAVPCPPPSTPP